jgi:hypothetical protein
VNEPPGRRLIGRQHWCNCSSGLMIIAMFILNQFGLNPALFQTGQERMDLVMSGNEGVASRFRSVKPNRCLRQNAGQTT